MTSRNRVLVIQNEALVQTLQLGEKEELHSLVATRRGFVVGGANRVLSVYELDRAFNANMLISTVGKAGSAGREDKIIKVHTSSNDGYLTVVTTNEVGSFNYFYVAASRIDSDLTGLEPFFSSGFHNKKVNSLACSVTKQILGSCSEDNTVKLWNFFEIEGYDKKGLISQNFG